MAYLIRRFWLVGFLAVSLLSAPTFAAAPTADQALKLSPIQKEVDYDRPTAEQAAKCTIKAEKVGNQTGWVVRDESGQVLREFADTAGDNVVDRWSYYKDGVEIYRDIDSNNNGKADQYRWLNTAGTRWGLDADEDGRIDSWKVISAEEVTAEVVGALRNRDLPRFNRLLLTSAELKSLPLSATKVKDVTDKLRTAPAAFGELAKSQKLVGPKTDWVHFGGTQPGIVPAGTDGSTGDLLAYENVLAMIETDGQHGQLPIGTLVRVGETWRLIDVPRLPAEVADAVPSGFFFTSEVRRPEQTEAAANPIEEKTQKLLAELEKLEDKINNTTSPAEKTRLHAERADSLERLASEAPDKEHRTQWVRQMADTVSAGAQSGEFPGGVERLKTLYEKLAKDIDKDLTAYVRFRHLTADYGVSLQAPNADFAKVQAAWLESLEKFVTDYPKSADSAEALLQLGIAQEFAGEEDKAKKWYRQILSDFPDSSSAKKAGGAVTRLECVGRPIQLKGRNPAGGVVDLSQLKGKVVLIQYWATWCEPCKADMANIKEMIGKYGKQGFAVIGVNLDSNAQLMSDYLSKNKLPWPQIFEPGGLDSRLANEMGILTLPTMMLVDVKGNVVNRSIHVTELENELKNQLK